MTIPVPDQMAMALLFFKCETLKSGPGIENLIHNFTDKFSVAFTVIC